MSSKSIFKGHTIFIGFNNILKKLIVYSNQSHYIVLIRLKCVVFVLELKYRKVFIKFILDNEQEI